MNGTQVTTSYYIPSAYLTEILLAKLVQHETISSGKTTGDSAFAVATSCT